jgi:hypothetical protein
MAKRGGLETTLLLLGVGAGLMYLFDPQQGTERRAQLRDRVTELQARAEKAMDPDNINELRSRASNIASTAGQRLSEAADDLESKTARKPGTGTSSQA